MWIGVNNGVPHAVPSFCLNKNRNETDLTVKLFMVKQTVGKIEIISAFLPSVKMLIRRRQYSLLLCVCFLFTRHCLCQRHNPRWALLLSGLQQWHQWGLLQNRGRPDCCHYLSVCHHGCVSDWSHSVSQAVETWSCTQIRGASWPGGRSSASYVFIPFVYGIDSWNFSFIWA